MDWKWKWLNVLKLLEIWKSKSQQLTKSTQADAIMEPQFFIGLVKKITFFYSKSSFKHVCYLRTPSHLLVTVEMQKAHLPQMTSKTSSTIALDIQKPIVGSTTAMFYSPLSSSQKQSTSFLQESASCSYWKWSLYLSSF